MIITTFGGIGVDLLHDNESVEEAAEIPLLAAMFVAIVWLANRRIAADRERQLMGEKNSRLLEAQRRFLQDASHHLRTPITIALTTPNSSPATSTAEARTPPRRSGARRRRPRRWPGRRR